MRIGADPPVELTYCTNVHPGESWADTLAALAKHLPAIKQQVAPDRPFGVGLRLSAAAAQSLAEPEALDSFRAFLADHDLYVFTLNGFPFGQFHGTRVKEAVYRPDWRDPARLAYTNRLADLLAALLPDGMAGSISTVPGAFKAELRDDADVTRMADGMLRHLAHLARIEAASGRTIRLALEPEPCCFLETIEETIRFFEDHLFSSRAAGLLASEAGLPPTAAQVFIREHIGVCFDVCHAAVEFEAEDVFDRLAAAGILIPKLQLSSALRLRAVNGDAGRLLAPFDDGVYLHQVVERRAGTLRRFADLSPALAALDAEEGAREWRVHFHVPVFLDELGDFSTTQDYLKAVIARQRDAPISSHLEVETYTWNVLPEAYRQSDLAADIGRELAWVRRELAA